MFEAMETIQQIFIPNEMDLLIANFQCSMDSLHTATTLASTLEQLEVFQDTVATFGLSRELLAFADHNQILSSAIPEIPSLEAYLADANIDLMVANESILTSIKEVAHRFADTFLMHIKKYQNWYLSAVQYLAATLTILLNKDTLIGVSKIMNISGNIPIDLILKVLASPKVIIPAITTISLMAAIAYARSAPLAVKEALQLTLPTDVQARSDYVKKVRKIFLDKTRVDIDKIGVSTLSESETGKSARELGYTKEHVGEIIHDITLAVEEIKRCDFIPTELKRLSQTVEATTSNGRAALIFLTGVITKVMHLAVTDTMKAAQQMKKLDSAVTHAVEQESEKK